MKCCFSTQLEKVLKFFSLLWSPLIIFDLEVRYSRNRPLFRTSMHNYPTLTSTTILHYTVCLTVLPTLTVYVRWIHFLSKYIRFNFTRISGILLCVLIVRKIKVVATTGHLYSFTYYKICGNLPQSSSAPRTSKTGPFQGHH
jgi:hypothetical protein